MKSDPNDIPRYTPEERTNHWLVAITFILLALSGLAFFHPAFFFLSHVLGGGVWARILHPFIGVVMALSFASMYVRFAKLNVITPTDWEWLKRMGDLLKGNAHNMPEAGKYNGGQKVLFWLMVICMALLLLSGVVIWRAYFSDAFPIWLIRFSSLMHAAFGALLIILIMGHIYMAIWTKDSIRAMTRGTVTRAWAKHHHPAWYRQMTGGGK